MSEQLALINLIEKKPDQKVNTKILADWMMEYHAMPRFTALRFAAKYRRSVIASREIARAASLFAEKSPARWWLFGEIEESIGRSEEDTLEVYLVSGSRPPKAALVASQQQDGEPLVFSVLVGARWVIRRAEDMAFEISERGDNEPLPFDEPH